jgi:hypothetical protein
MFVIPPTPLPIVFQISLLVIFILFMFIIIIQILYYMYITDLIYKSSIKQEDYITDIEILDTCAKKVHITRIIQAVYFNIFTRPCLAVIQRHDIAEILLKLVIKHQTTKQSINHKTFEYHFCTRNKQLVRVMYQPSTVFWFDGFMT